jgi:hypothetical protein
MSSAPWDFGEAIQACRNASRAQEQTEQQVKEAAVKLAEAEEQYRLALAREIVRAHDQDGLAWSVCADVARGTVEVARLRKQRDIAEGVYEAMRQAAWRRVADRRDAQRFSDWSQRREFAEQPVQTEAPAW